MLLMTWVRSLVEAMTRSGRRPVWIDVEGGHFEACVHNPGGATVLFPGLCGVMQLPWDGVGVGARLWERIGSSGTR